MKDWSLFCARFYSCTGGHADAIVYQRTCCQSPNKGHTIVSSGWSPAFGDLFFCTNTTRQMLNEHLRWSVCFISIAAQRQRPTLSLLCSHSFNLGDQDLVFQFALQLHPVNLGLVKKQLAITPWFPPKALWSEISKGNNKLASFDAMLVWNFSESPTNPL